MKSKTISNPKGAGRPGGIFPTYLAQVSGLTDSEIAYLKSINASRYIRELIRADLAKKLPK